MITPKENTDNGTEYGMGNLLIAGCCYATDSVPCPVCGHSISLDKTECPLCRTKIITILRKRKIST